MLKHHAFKSKQNPKTLEDKKTDVCARARACVCVRVCVALPGRVAIHY